ncbi:MAG: nuclear transport factor 2 family protein [Phenylobacterium sp.]
MRHAFLIAAVVLAFAGPAARAVSAADPKLEAELIALEKQSWVAWQGHDGGFFDRFLTADHVEMQGNGPAGKAGVVGSVANGGCTVKSYMVDRFQVTQFSADTALLTYRAEQDTTCGQGHVPSPVWATSLFVKRDGRWQNALYVHSPAVK